MINKKVIRKENAAGKFTTVHHAILNDNRLSSTDFRILVSILSDADHFNLTRELIINRFGLNKKTVQQSFKNLEDCGYLRRAELKRGYFYTISEYGNMNNKENNEVHSPVIQEVITMTPTKRPAVLTEGSIIDLEDYKELILAIIPNDTPTQIIMDFYRDIQSRIDVGTISKPEQLSKTHLEKIMAKYISVDVSLDSFISNLCENHAGGKGITIAQQKEITSKTLNFFKNFDGTISEKLVKSKIWTYKSKFTSSGHLDQRYQN